MLLRPKNWEKFQHYKDRCPPWIKLHRDLLNDRAFMMLPLASKALAPLFWLLASESKHKDGTFDASDEELEFRLRIPAKEIRVGRNSLIDKGFFLVASDVLADASNLHTNATPEGETETEGETEKRQKTALSALDVLFDEFWKAYPKKVGKDAARKAFAKRQPTAELLSLMVNAVSEQSKSDTWRKDGGQFIPHPATWINEGRWQDEAVSPPSEKVGADAAQATLKSLAERDKGVAPMPASVREQIASLTGKLTGKVAA